MNPRGLSSSTRGRSELIDFIKDEDWIKKNVIENHSHDSTAEGNFNPNDLLNVVNNILIGTNELIHKDGDSKQMKCEATPHKNQEERLQEFFQELSSYQWITQVLVVLAAFAEHYGSFWYFLLAPCDGNALLKGLSSLKMNLMSDTDKKAINRVVNELLDLTTVLSRLVDMVHQNRGKHLPRGASETIPLWSCQSIIAILAAGNYFTQLINDNKFHKSELEDLESKVSNKKKEVSTMHEACEEALASREKYQEIVKKLEDPVDIVDFLITLLTGKDSSQDPILTDPNKTPVCSQ